MRYFRAFLALAAFFLFTAGSCEDECFFIFNDDSGPTLAVTRDSDALQRSVGEALTLESSFPAAQTSAGMQYSISEGGGLVIVQAYRLIPGTDTVVAARDQFTAVANPGDLAPVANTPEPATFGLRFTCPAQNCAFRLQLTPEEAGTYLMLVRGSVIDRIDAAFERCNGPSFSTTTVAGSNHLLTLNPTGTFVYDNGDFARPLDVSTGALFAVEVE